jgi:hypothetical protein
MHDIDSTRLEAFPGYEREDQQESESYNGEGEEAFEMPMTEAEEEALAAELLGVSSEADLEQFLGGLFRKVKRSLGGAARFLAKNAGPLAGALKGIAGKALPFLGGALGTAIPIPGVGTALGAALGNAASGLLQSETENMEAEEQQFEMAKRYVRLASQAIRNAGRIPPRNPSAAANLALRNAFQRFRGSGGYWQQPTYIRYRKCPPCPPPEPCPACPTCSQPLPAADAPSADSASTQPGVNAPQTPSTTAEAEFGDAGEFQYAGESEANDEFANTQFENADESEGENYETDNEAPSLGAPRSGQWVRRGRKIVLYGL